MDNNESETQQSKGHKNLWKDVFLKRTSIISNFVKKKKYIYIYTHTKMKINIR